MTNKKFLVYKNKILYKLFIHLRIAQNYFVTINIINSILANIQKEFLNISPVYVIEKAIFNILLPITYNKFNYDRNKLHFIGVSLNYSISKAIILIIKHSKIQFKKSISDKISLIFIQIYKKEHFLFKQKNIYLNKILNI